MTLAQDETGKWARVTSSIEQPAAAKMVVRRSGRTLWRRLRRRFSRPSIFVRPTKRQGQFGFIERRRERERTFKRMIIGCTLLPIALLLAVLPTGRYAANWVRTRGRWVMLRTVGLEPDRSEIDADWARKRSYDLAQARSQLGTVFDEYTPKQQELLRFAGMDPAHVLLRWGNFDRTVMLPSTVFEADETGRSYRFKPNVRSIWVRNFPSKGNVKAYFQVPDLPEARPLVRGAGATLVDESVQLTNSWGLRGPEPKTDARWRGIVLGDSYMQGLFVGDNETPTECLKRRMHAELKGSVEILNTGHLGYSPEQYYYSLVEFGERFKPSFVVISMFANDFGEVHEVLDEGRGDWFEAEYWLGRIRQYCLSKAYQCLFVPAPWVNQVEGPSQSGFYPGRVSNVMGTGGAEYLDPISAFANAHLELMNAERKPGETAVGNPLFQGKIGDGHFSVKGCEVWAEAVARRMVLLIERRGNEGR
jgi:hypothetical protein